MSQRAQLKQFILRALLRRDGKPETEAALFIGAKAIFTEMHVSDLIVALKELEHDGFVCADTDKEVSEVTTWTLTTKGTHKAKQL